MVKTPIAQRAVRRLVRRVVTGQNTGREAAHRSLHTTRSVDFAIIMSGEIDMLLDSGEVHLEAGDTFVQQGTAHGYINRGSETCRIAFILVDATAD